MRKVLVSLLLVFSLLFSVVSLSACSVFNKDSDDVSGNTTDDGKDTTGTNNQVSIPVDVQAMLDGKYSDFEIPREKLEGALSDALDKVQYMIVNLDGKFH